MKYKFRLSADPLGSKRASDVKARINKHYQEIPGVVLSGELLTSRTTVWVVTFDEQNVPAFASSKMVCYAKSVNDYLDALDRKLPMTGVDAVTALRKRGFIDCNSADYPKLASSLKHG